MSPKPSPSAQFPSGRGRGPAPWTIWELMAITVSILMIVVPLIVEGLNWIQPPIAPAQGLMAATGPTIELEQRPPTFTPVATNTPTSGTPTPNTPTPITPTPVTPTADTPTPVTPTPVTPTPVTPTADTPTPVTPTPVTPTPVTPTPVTPTPVTPTPVTTTPIPTLTPSPTPGATRVTKVASLTTVNIGQDFSYSLSVTTQSDSPITLTLRDVLVSDLEPLSASAFGGTCSTSGQTIVCTLTVSRLNPASVTLQVRVRPSASGGSNILNQAVLEQGSVQIGVSNVVSVRVLGIVTPTAQITNTPTQVGTDTPTPVTPTLIPVTPVTPVATNTPVPSPPPPSPTPPRPRPTEALAPTPPPPPPTEPPPVVLPTEPPPPTPVVTVAPRPTATPRPRPPASPTRTPTPAVSPTPTEPPALAVFSESDLLLRLTSDWGSAYADQDIVFTIVLGNTHPAQTVSAVNVRSVMPSNLRILSASASRGSDPTINGQTVTYIAPDLAPGERVEINIATRIRPDVAAGTLLVVQAQASYRELSRPVFSNISTVLVVGEQQAATATATLAPVISPTFTTTPVAVRATPTPSLVATATATPDVVLGSGTSATVTVTPSATATAVAAGGQAGGAAPLPNTSAGIPFLGFLLLGATLLTRTIRLHRARERI